MIQFNLFLIVFLAVFLLRFCIQFYLNRINLAHLRKHGTSVPEIFKDTVDLEKLKKISAYTVDSDRFGIIVTLLNQALFLIILLSGFLPWLVAIAKTGGVVVSGLIFFAILALISSLVRIPCNLYETFVIEERYGFNTMDFKMWISDFFKSLAIVAVLGGVLLLLLLALIVHGGKTWWLWAWILVSLYELLMMWLYPVVIAPLFNKFEPIENTALVDRIKTLMEKAGLHSKGVFKMDAGKRSKHSNAYFTGIGRNKRIVLFDTLLSSHTDDEILAVLAHEIGHWKKKHVLKQILMLEVVSFIVFYLTSLILKWPFLYRTFGFQEPILYVGLFLIEAILGLLGFFFEPLEAAFSRKNEREADDFAMEHTGSPEPMISTLKRLAADNLSNLTPHPVYAWFYYSHPPLAERISRLASRKPGHG